MRLHGVLATLVALLHGCSSEITAPPADPPADAGPDGAVDAGPRIWCNRLLGPVVEPIEGDANMLCEPGECCGGGIGEAVGAPVYCYLPESTYPAPCPEPLVLCDPVVGPVVSPTERMAICMRDECCEQARTGEYQCTPAAAESPCGR